MSAWTKCVSRRKGAKDKEAALYPLFDADCDQSQRPDRGDYGGLAGETGLENWLNGSRTSQYQSIF